jgi:hypothetical protein
MKLPSKQELPDYYNIIKKPIDIKKIQQRLEENKVSFEVCATVGSSWAYRPILAQAFSAGITGCFVLLNKRNEH